LAVSGIVTALGWSLLFPQGGSGLVIVVLSAGVLPFVVKSVSGALVILGRGPAESARCLGAGPLRAAFGVDLASVRPAMISAGAFAFAIAAGDLNAPILLARGDFEPVPVLLYRLTSAYRFPEACAAGLLLALMTAAAFLAKEGRRGRA
jgi:ABC-type Fe3+ transport system permease subunit